MNLTSLLLLDVDPTKEGWDERRREHSYVKDTPPPGVDPLRWDAERLAQSYYPKRPSISYVPGTRIGHLIPGIEGDHWWRIKPQDTNELDDALAAILQYGLPHLRAGMAR